MKQAEILLPTAAPHGFDYRVPEGMALKAGDIVAVPFGRGQSLGVVWGEGKANLPAAKMKNVGQQHLQFPPLSNAMRQFIDWAAWYNCAPKGAMLKMVLPIDDIAKEGRTSIDTAMNADHLHLADLSDMQKKAASALEEKIGRGFSVTLLDGVTGSGKTEVYFDAVAKALGVGCQVSGVRNNELSSVTRHPSPVTPSQILVLLPEIALTIQWLERFEKRFGFTPVVWNSEITPARKRAAWQAIAKGEARVVVGARSALFLPYKHLSLLIVDEEHDQSYKQEDGVIYHARDMAVARGRFEKLPVILVSATPSLESYYNVKQGKYTEVSLPVRHGGAVLPEIDIIDMQHAGLERGAFISQPLREKLAESIAAGRQCMLFLNRRGYAPLLLCRHCGHHFECPQCSSWMVLHKKRRHPVAHAKHVSTGSGAGDPAQPLRVSQDDGSYLQCHHCDHRQPVPDACPACGSKDELYPCGPGVERVREEVESFLPQARVAVMASDSIDNYQMLSKTITDMSEGRIDLLIGTQMIAKGHHFAGLALVGVVDADLGLAGGDLRAAERTYQLLHQLSGRAGREQVRGKVYLQSFLPGHPVMKALLCGARDAFMQAELAARERAHMPPFSRLAAVIIEGTKEGEVIKTAKSLASAGFQSAVSNIRILGPSPAPLYRLRNHYRYRLLARADRNVNLPDFMKSWLDSVKAPSSVRVKADIDPVSFL